MASPSIIPATLLPISMWGGIGFGKGSFQDPQRIPVSPDTVSAFASRKFDE
jgi:hypothetical protein